MDQNRSRTRDWDDRRGFPCRFHPVEVWECGVCLLHEVGLKQLTGDPDPLDVREGRGGWGSERGTAAVTMDV